MWQSISPEIISNDFKRAVIHPVNEGVILKDSYTSAVLKRFEEYNNMQKMKIFRKPQHRRKISLSVTSSLQTNDAPVFGLP